eukprot:gnl/TRDRNA2_/TRDRNA2_120489_c0_seq2.p2 gnl/TRDRNA2_/TRDRNA2_120489_c0~~gnl/TRDRNA2_/TRDRNA2_120489_c0_seq2.p2  ORF type:complete len:112 (-),score=24.95 gnl/TRDRNA2_/TRDRNA2_120489_c0_seq2:322-657(-)
MASSRLVHKWLSAASSGNLQALLQLIDEWNIALDAAAADGSTALTRAAQEGHLKVVQYLVEEGAAVDLALNNGSTALSLAAGNGHLKIVRYLAEQGAAAYLGGEPHRSMPR